jgi:transposase
MKLTRVGVDLAKQVFQVHGVDRAERPVWCQRLKRGRWIGEFERSVEPGCEIGMEACGGAPSAFRRRITRPRAADDNALAV